ncbi:MAG: 50S ribosomal protein L9 [Deferribacteres bacterium]|nr:50S ribosomal protein L9 [candidate division KSB1 bacterium]MCB9510411.1 50S ribosomal protein L9 [Deferribacteres bacterium]
MKVILRQKHESLGDVGEVVAVKAGYASNYLIPKGIAMAATPKNLRVIEQEKERLLAAALREKKDAEDLKEKLDTISVTAEVQVGEEEKVFGAVTTQHIAELMADKGFEVDRRKIVLEEPIKALGVYEVPIKLHPDVVSTIKVWVVRQG